MELEHDEPELTPNLPTRRTRHDGWTVERQEAFLKALAACGCVSHACRAVGMSRESAYELYNRPSAFAFRRGWEAALDCSIGQVEDSAVERSRYGVSRPIFYKGQQVGEYRHFDERLTMFLLRYRRPHRLPPPPPPVHPPGWDAEGPDPDEAIGRLDWHFDELVDEADCPAVSAEPRARMIVSTLSTSSEMRGPARPTKTVIPASSRDPPFPGAILKGRWMSDQDRHDECGTRFRSSRLRVNVRLIDTSDGRQVWEEEYEGRPADGSGHCHHPRFLMVLMPDQHWS